MKWVDILKETVTQSRVKEIEDIDIDIEDDDCNRKLQQMANKLKNYNLLLKQRWEAGWPKHQEYYEIVGDEKNAEYSTFQIKVKREHRYFSTDSFMFESTASRYNPIPEEVACKALEILETTPRTNLEYGSAQSTIFNGFELIRDFNFDYQYNTNALEVRDPQGVEKIRLSWANGEDTAFVHPYGSRRSVNLATGTNNLYVISGYYDAREFGFSWHE
tara:strand:- start:3397 stop:4047 length:651 start_codon:yes stop_codon:yes gene_type:complete